MDVNPNTDVRYSDVTVTARRKLNWAAIVGGMFTTLAIAVLLLYLGSALGLSIFSARDVTQGDLALSWAAIAWLAFSVIVSSFLGAWVAGRWSNVWMNGDATAHGVLSWALSTVVLTIAAGGLLQLSAAAAPSRDLTSAGNAENANTPSAMVTAGAQQNAPFYNNLDDQQFTGFVLNKAKAWESAHGIKGSEEPVNVSNDQNKNQKADQHEAKNPAKSEKDVSIKNKDELTSFVALNTNMSKDQARQFLSDDSKDISQAQSQSQQRWNQAHSADLAREESMRKGASAIAWTMFGLTALALISSVIGARAGWQPLDSDRYVAREGEIPPATTERTL